LVLDRGLSERRIFPAIDVKRSGTRREELLFTEEELRRIWQLRRLLNSLETDRAAEVLLSGLQKSPSNKEFLLYVERLRPEG
jgi:transcription termination factor Rho